MDYCNLYISVFSQVERSSLIESYRTVITELSLIIDQFFDTASSSYNLQLLHPSDVKLSHRNTRVVLKSLRYTISFLFLSVSVSLVNSCLFQELQINTNHSILVLNFYRIWLFGKTEKATVLPIKLATT